MKTGAGLPGKVIGSPKDLFDYKTKVLPLYACRRQWKEPRLFDINACAGLFSSGTCFIACYKFLAVFLIF